MNKRMGIRIIGASLVIVFSFPCLGHFSAAAQTEQWIQFQDPPTGLTFRYPPNLRIHTRDPQKFGLPNIESIVDVTGDTKLNRNTAVLRFLVNRGQLTSHARAEKLELLRKGCKRMSSLMIDGHKAIVCVSAGSAAIRWSVEILEPRECTIVTLMGGADADQALPPPHDSEFPLLSIMRTVHFTAPPGSVSVSLVRWSAHRQTAYARSSSKSVISGGASKRMGTAMVPMPRLT